MKKFLMALIILFCFFPRAHSQTRCSRAIGMGIVNGGITQPDYSRLAERVVYERSKISPQPNDRYYLNRQVLEIQLRDPHFRNRVEQNSYYPNGNR